MRAFSSIAGVCCLSMLIGGCTTTPVIPGPIPPGPGPSACNAAAASWAIGERARPGVLERATLDSGARTARVIEPGEVVTMEFSPDRLTIDVDGRNVILNARCG
jgi:hypothetical protein